MLILRTLHLLICGRVLLSTVFGTAYMLLFLYDKNNERMITDEHKYH